MPSITIYTKGWCPYCSAAKKLLDDKGDVVGANVYIYQVQGPGFELVSSVSLK